MKFHGFLFKKLDIPGHYEAIAPRNIEDAITGVRALNIRGAAVSMPYKQAVIPLVDECSPEVLRINAINTIVNDDGYLRAYNTDYLAIKELINHDFPLQHPLIRGTGGMARAVVMALAEAGYEGTVWGRTKESTLSLAEQAQWEALVTEDPSSHPLLHPSQLQGRTLINATPLGMAGGNEGEWSFKQEQIASCLSFIEVIHGSTPSLEYAHSLSKPTITGGAIIAAQAALQFELYTGVSLSPELIEEARSHAQGRKLL